MNFLKKIFLRPVTVCTIAILVFGFGILAALNMPVNLLPDIAFPALGVTIAYPGASAQTCDETVRPLLDSALKTLSNVKSITSYSIENATMAAIQFEYGTDVDKKTDEIKDKLALVSFPDSCYDPIYTKIDFNGNAVATVTVYNDNDEEQAYADAKAIREKLLSVENVGSVDLSGVPEDKIVISTFNGLEMTSLLLVQQLATNSKLDIPLGTLTESGGKVSFRNDSSPKSIEEIENTYFQMPVSKELGQSLSLAKTAMKYLQETTSATLIEYRDGIKSFSDTISSINVKTGEEIFKELDEQINIDELVAGLRELGFNDLANSTQSLYDLLKNNPALINIPGEIIVKIQNECAKVLTDDFFKFCDEIIEFKKEYEYTNPVTGELIQEEIKASDFVKLLKRLDVGLPIDINEDFVSFVEQHEFSDLTYDADGNANLTLKISDVASVKEERSFSSYAYYNGRQAVTLKVYGISGANAAKISSGVRKIVNEFSGSSVAVMIDDQSQFITDSVSNVISSMIIGGVLAVIVILLFLKKLRTSLVIAVTMPLSVLGAMGCMYFMGITLNMVSLGGLAVGIGMLVDNSIVIIESINCERDKGKSAYVAAIDGTRLVASSLVASTLTSVCVFFPILFTKGLTEMIFADLSWSVIFSLVFSLIVALTVIPTLYCLVCSDKKMLTGRPFGKRPAKKHAPASAVKETSSSSDENSGANDKKPVKRTKKNTSFVQATSRFYDGFLRKCLRARWLVLVLTLLVFAASTTIIFTTGTDFMPSVDQKTIEVNIVFDSADELSYCKAKTYEVYEAIRDNVADVKHLSADVSNSSLISTSVHGTIRLVLNDNAKKKTKTVLEEIRKIAETDDSLSLTVTEVDGVLASLMSSFGGVSNIGVTIEGEDVAVLKEIAEKVSEKATSSYDYFTRVTNNLSSETPEYSIKIDGQKCFENGIDYSVAVATLRAGIAGYSACTVTVSGNQYDVSVKFRDGTINEYYGGIDNYVLSFSGDKSVKLKDIAVITKTLSPTQIVRQNGKYVMNLAAESTGIDSGTAADAFAKVVADVLSGYEGYVSQESGVNHYLNEVFQGLAIAMIIAFILLFAVMACQFESLSKPFIVIFSIPLSFSGAFLALSISGLTLNVVSFIGIIMLMGVVVNNAIVMIDRIEQLRTEEGYSAYDALIEGSKSRMRAIWMSTLTTVLALIPLALAIGRGSELMQPLGVVVIGGLTLATLVTLVIIPIMFSIVKRVPIPKKAKNGNGELAETAAEKLSAENASTEKTATLENEEANENVFYAENTEAHETDLTETNKSADESISQEKVDNNQTEEKENTFEKAEQTTVETSDNVVTLICDGTKKLEIIGNGTSKIIVKCKDAKTVSFTPENPATTIVTEEENTLTAPTEKKRKEIVENYNNGKGISERYVSVKKNK